MPLVFLGHGSPMNAIEDTAYSRAWTELGRALPRPQAILVAPGQHLVHLHLDAVAVGGAFQVIDHRVAAAVGGHGATARLPAASSVDDELGLLELDAPFVGGGAWVLVDFDAESVLAR